MVRRDLTDEQIKARILDELIIQEAYGKYHIPVDQMKKWLQNKIKRNGKTIEHCIDDLVRQGLVQKTSRNTIYAVRGRLKEIIAFIDENNKD